jgi:hypothetical protein
MTDLPTPVWSGSFVVFGVELKVHVLDDGRRIIEKASMERLLEAMEAGADPGDLEGFVRWQRGL